jgi:hypothetical protein
MFVTVVSGSYTALILYTYCTAKKEEQNQKKFEDIRSSDQEHNIHFAVLHIISGY